MVTGVNSSRTGGWILENNILNPAGLLSFSDNSNYYDSIFSDVQDKANAGFPISLTVSSWSLALFRLLPFSLFSFLPLLYLPLPFSHPCRCERYSSS
jgi:hypothetical protein